MSDRRFTQFCCSVFATLALLLAAVGIYGVVAFWVAQRTQEIGLRVALGATAENIFRLLLLQTTLPVVAGLALGLAAAGMLTPYLSSQIYGVTAERSVDAGRRRDSAGPGGGRCFAITRAARAAHRSDDGVAGGVKRRAEPRREEV